MTSKGLVWRGWLALPRIRNANQIMFTAEKNLYV